MGSMTAWFITREPERVADQLRRTHARLGRDAATLARQTGEIDARVRGLLVRSHDVFDAVQDLDPHARPSRACYHNDR